ncbi:probable LRR receptor-like serine/threonine-protein kinase At1g05700 [Eucalyptus grandis]|uniref:probable LRR receptor-like serine/threonine-protein kinase At1g05700 n=1 Tax=Eucalyptus grandis TaxID=71139 RepID=UPI00192EC2EE|nr:probable LRR receptor-like serine/threonine-protein kinase At1g05700 [Eucalyptus grandis]
MTMERSITAFSFALLAGLVSSLVPVVQAQQIPGFISIDCGATNVYTEDEIRIRYETDEGFIDSGQNKQISMTFIHEGYRQCLNNLRSFPNRKRNCYTLKPDQGKNNTYLIRARFYYGNYDEKNQIPSFDLYIDVNYWTTVNYLGPGYEEIMYVSPADDIQVCLVNTGNGVPFISALELRHIDDDGIYRLRSGFLEHAGRLDIGGASDSFIRYPKDVYDRIWETEDYAGWIFLDTPSIINSSDDNDAYKVPSEVLRTAQSSINGSTPLRLGWTPSSSAEKWIVYFYFVEIERLTNGLQREFTVSMNDNQFMEIVSLEYLKPVVVVSTPVSGSLITFSIESTNKSGNPPILNAVEFYTIGDLPNVPTAQDDVKAINDIKATYHIQKESWQGDPCIPSIYTWDGLNCSNGNPPRIISLKLSSSNLVGDIVSSLSRLSTMEDLDLSNNKLTGAIPETRRITKS